MAHENSFGIEIILRLLRKGCSYVIFDEGERNPTVLPRECQSGRSLRGRADERHALEVGAIVTGGLEPLGLKLRSEVFGCEFLSPRADPTSFQLVTGQVLHVSANLLAGYVQTLSRNRECHHGAGGQHTTEHALSVSVENGRYVCTL